MSDASERAPVYDPTETMPLPLLGIRGAIGGVLMGLANLVPGISGGTMLLAAGVYPGFISSIASLYINSARLWGDEVRRSSGFCAPSARRRVNPKAPITRRILPGEIRNPKSKI